MRSAIGRGVAAVTLSAVLVVAGLPSAAVGLEPVSYSTGSVEAWLAYVNQYMVYHTGAGVSSATAVADVASATGLNGYQATQAIVQTETALNVRGIKPPAGVSVSGLAAGLVIGAVVSYGAEYVLAHTLPSPIYYNSDGTLANGGEGFDLLKPSTWDGEFYAYWPEGWFFDAEWDPALEFMFGELPDWYLEGEYEVWQNASGVDLHQGVALANMGYATDAGAVTPSGVAPSGLTTAAAGVWSEVMFGGNGRWVTNATRYTAASGSWWGVMPEMINNVAQPGQVYCSECGQVFTVALPVNSAGRITYWGWNTGTPGLISADQTRWNAVGAHLATCEGAAPDVLEAPAVAPIEITWPSPVMTPSTYRVKKPASWQEEEPEEVTVGDLSGLFTLPSAVPQDVIEAIETDNPEATDVPVVDIPTVVGTWVSTTWSDLTEPVVSAFFSMLDWFWPFHFMAENG